MRRRAAEERSKVVADQILADLLCVPSERLREAARLLKSDSSPDSHYVGDALEKAAIVAKEMEEDFGEI